MPTRTALNTAAILVILAAALLSSSGCRSSLNADQFIADTLSGAEGAIKRNLNPGLSEDEKTAIARYVLPLQPLAGETIRLLDEVAALRLATRSSSEEVRDGYRVVVARFNYLIARLRQLDPPESLLAAHNEILASYDVYVVALRAYTEAFALLDFPALQRSGSDLAAATQTVLASHERMERESAPLFQPGRGMQLIRQT